MTDERDGVVDARRHSFFADETPCRRSATIHTAVNRFDFAPLR
jgi:hypothetical protein